MSRLVSASDYRREIRELEGMIEEQEGLAKEAGDDFAAQLSLASLRARLEELQEELAALGDEGLPAHELDVVLSGNPIEQNMVDAEFLGVLLKDLQKVVRALVSSELGHFSRTGPWAEEVERRSTLRFAGSFAGSFGMRLEAVDEQLELEGYLAIQPALDSLFNLIEEGPKHVGLLEALAPLGPRARSHLRKLLKEVSKAGAEMELSWPLVAGERRARISPSQASEMVDILSRVDETEDLRKVEGLLEGANLRTNFFEIQTEEGEIIDGKVSSDILQKISDFFGRTCRATLVVTHTVDRGTGEERDTYRLLALEEVE